MYLRAFVLTIALGQAFGSPRPPFRVFTMQDGLVRNWVTQIRRDSRGYLWFCTAEGVSLFDGYRFTNFGTRDGLPNRLVTDMVETPQGEYWFATAGGLARFHPEHRGRPAFEAVAVGDDKASNLVSRLYQDSQGTIWSATEGGLYAFHPRDRGGRPRKVSLGSEEANVLSLTEDSVHCLWVCTSLGLRRLHPDGTVDRVAVKGPILGRILTDRQGRVWGAGQGIFRIHPDPKAPYASSVEHAPGVLTGSWINGLYLGDEGEIWMGGKFGLARFLPDAKPEQRFLVYEASDSLPIRDVLAFAQDSERNFWVGSGTLGAVRIAAGSFQLFTEADAREVVGLMEDRKGVLYAITGGALNEFRGDRFVSIPILKRAWSWGQGAMALQDRQGEWWIGSAAGVHRYPAVEAQRLQTISPKRVYNVKDGLPGWVVLQLMQDSRGDIWAGTTDGVARWDRSSGVWHGFGGGLLGTAKPEVAVRALAEDRSGAVWVGLSHGGVVRFRGSKFDVLDLQPLRGAINALLLDSQGRLWIGSSQGGVGRVDDPSAPRPHLVSYGLAQGLSSEHVFSLAEDRWGRIYVAGGRGVDRLDPKAGSGRHFNSSSGLPDGETQVLFRDCHGDIWFVSLFGVSRYRPEAEDPALPPAVLIRSVSIAGEPYAISELGVRALAGLQLRPERKNLDIEFRALHFAAGDRLRYQFRLEGADGDWSKPGDDQTVRYANLAPGRYRFAVRSVAESGAASPEESVLDFDVLPVFWRRTWFIALVMGAMVAGAVWLHRYRVNHMLALERVRTRLATDLHDDLGAGLAEIAILSEVAKRDGPPRTVELLDRMGGRARALRGAMGDIVWTMDPREDCLAALVFRMRQTALGMLEDDGRRVEFRSPADDELTGEVAPDMRRHVLLFFKEAITNIARHARATAVEVDIKTGGGRFDISIRDNGRGFDPSQANGGQGLKSLTYRACELGAEYRLESSPERGTEIELRMQL